MTSNIGIWDRTLRIVVGLALISLVFVRPQTLWGLLGFIPLVSGLARFCPAYRVAGVSTCGKTVADAEGLNRC